MKTKILLENLPLKPAVRAGIALLLLAASANAFDGSGSGTAADPYQIVTAAQLQEMGSGLSAQYTLMNDVDATVTATWNGGAGFMPVGSVGAPFTGSLDGRSHAIRNLAITMNNGDQIGLFGYTGPGSAIENVTMDNAAVSAVDWVGTMAGTNNGTLRNCHATGSVNGGGSFGGLVGTNNGTIEHCSSGVTVYGGSHLGGLVGVSSGVIRNCYATGSVSGGEDPGGLVGINAGLIENCYATGSVSTNYWWNPSYARGAGGLVGMSTSQAGAAGSIINSFSTGNVSGPDARALGGLVGVNVVASGQPVPVIENCHYNHTAGNPAAGLGQNPAGSTIGITAIENNEAYFFNNANPPESTWNFTSIWGFPSGVAGVAYPCFRSAYQMVVECIDSGGCRTTSADYTFDGSAGMLGGVSSISSPPATAKAGYIAQLYEVNALMVDASPATLNENATRQLAAWRVLDDDSQVSVSATSVAWSVLTGPLAVGSTGLATAGLVYQDTAATVQGLNSGLTGTLGLTVLDTMPDNYGSYAGDGLDDAWQNQYFGLNNPNAAPLMDPDGDGQNNRYEFIAGIVPTNPLSRFLLRVEPVAGQPAHKRLVFSPRWTDRTYNVVTSTTLEATSWSALTGGIVSDNGSERSVTDTAATAAKKFYRVEINKP